MGNSASLSSLPYTIGDEIEDINRPGSYGWSIHSGKRKSDGLPVCVFKGNKPKLIQTPVSSTFVSSSGRSIEIGSKKERIDSNCYLIPAFRHFQKSKTLVHPNILKVYATLDTDAPVDAAPASGGGVPSSASPYANTGTGGDLVIVTEEVVPLLKWLQTQKQRSSSNNTHTLGDQMAWGFVCIIQALSFLHSSAKLSHCSLSPESIYVTPGGDFKLGNFSLLQTVGGGEHAANADEDYFRTYEAYLCPTQYRCPERINGDYSTLLHSVPSHVMDSYSLGQLMEELYTTYTNLGIPEKLIKAIGRLKTPKIQQRPRVAPLLRCPAFDTPHVKSMEFLSDIDVKPSEEKILFLQSVPDQLTRHVLSPDALKHKLLSSIERTLQNIARTPTAIGQDINRREVMAIIPVIFIISEELNDDEFTSHISPLVSVLFQLNDRGVRATLLQRLDTMTSRLDKTSINATVFEPMCSGFTDSSGALRELTLKSTIPLIPHLTSVNLEKLGRYLVRLQSDSENSIRTNTVIFISKIAPSLSKVSREKLLLPAFMRAMKDPFYPCRIAALKSILQCQDFFPPKALAEQVLPCIAPHLMDPTEQVRKDAFHVMDQFMSQLRTESERMKQQQQQQQQGDPMSDGSTTNTAGEQAAVNHSNSNTVEAAPTSSGSYLSGLTSYMWSSSSSNKNVAAAATEGGDNTNANASTTTTTQMSSSSDYGQQQQQQQQGSTTLLSNNATNDDDGGGWSDDDNDEDDLLNTTSFDKFGGGTTKSSTTNMMANVSLSGNNSFLDTSNPDDFFSSSMVGTRHHHKTGGGGVGGINRVSTAAAGASSGTGSRLVVPGASSGGIKSSNTTKPSLADRKAEFARRKAEREAKQQQQQQASSKLNDQLTDGWDDF